MAKGADKQKKLAKKAPTTIGRSLFSSLNRRRNAFAHSIDMESAVLIVVGVDGDLSTR